MKQFAEKCRAILSSDSWHDKKLTVPGKKDYNPSDFKGVPQNVLCGMDFRLPNEQKLVENKEK